MTDNTQNENNINNSEAEINRINAEEPVQALNNTASEADAVIPSTTDNTVSKPVSDNMLSGSESIHTQHTPTYKNPYLDGGAHSAQASYTFSNDSSYGAETVAPKKKEKKNHGFLKAVALILACVIFSGAAGVGGAYFASKYLFDNDSSQVSSDNKSQNATNNKAPVTITKVENSATENTPMTEVIANIRNTVVEIVTENIQESQFYGKYVTSGAGSGVIISSDGYIITNNHVIEGANSIYVRTTDGTEYKATTVGTDAESDIGVIKIDASNLPYATLGNSDELKIGEEVIAIGNPLGSLGGTVTNGIISALNREITIDGNKMQLLQTNAAVNPGNSGGGLFNMSGHLIGIVNAKSSSSSSETSIEGLGFAIPINHAQKISADLMEFGYVKGKVSLGITVYSYEKDYTYMQGWQTYVIKAGVYVETAGKNTELQKNDRFVSIDGIAVSSMSDIKSVLADHKIGDTIEATVARVQDQKEHIVTVKLTCYEYTPDNAAN